MIGIIFAVIAIILGIIGRALFKDYDKWKTITPIIGVVLAVVFLIMSSVSYVSTGYTGILTTFGKVEENTLDAGLAFHLPWQNVVKMDNREQRLEFQLESFSKDIQQVDVQGSVNYNIDKTTAMNLYRDVGQDYPSILIGPRIKEDVKIVIAKYTAENLIENRQNASDTIFELLKSELAPKGINVISLAVENIDFTDAFESAVEAKQVATQEKQKAKTQQEQQTMEEEQKAERARIAAQAQADVQKIEAEAEAYAIKTKADAEAEANKKLNASLTSDLIEYNKILHWDGKLPQFTGGGGTIPVVNFDMAE